VCYIAAAVPTVCLLFPASAQWRSGGGGAVAEFPCVQSATIPRVLPSPRVQRVQTRAGQAVGWGDSA